MSPAVRREQLAGALAALERRLTAACEAAGRERSAVTLIAVTKTHPVEDVALLAELGVTDVGENRDQEAAVKAAALTELRWHFVGGLQTNKARSVTAYAAVVHSVDRPALAAALSAGAVRAQRSVDVLLQVSLDGDPARAGALPRDIATLAEHVADAPGLRLAGVMAVAPRAVDPAVAFAELATLSQRLRTRHPGAVDISAGMSGDLEQAVAYGATYVRVGTALLGPRPPALG
ncbi:MAG: YggS family pyridoxal phosphate-dependent enzyme [Frankiales bacterium]|nr:YggS family pyridoxal phosphate-dependent enzyme [Frankiales bacterium]